MKTGFNKADEVWVSDKAGGYLGIITHVLGDGTYYVSGLFSQERAIIKAKRDLTLLMTRVGMAKLADAQA